MEHTGRTEHDLADREGLRERCYQFAEGLDNRDWPLLERLCAPTVATDFSAWGIAPQALDRAAFVGLYRAAFWRPAMLTQHLYTNFRIALDGEAAEVRFNFLGQHYLAGFADGEEFQLRGQYTNQFVRAGDGWSLTGVALRVFFATGAARMLVPDS